MISQHLANHGVRALKLNSRIASKAVHAPDGMQAQRVSASITVTADDPDNIRREREQRWYKFDQAHALLRLWNPIRSTPTAYTTGFMRGWSKHSAGERLEQLGESMVPADMNDVILMALGVRFGKTSVSLRGALEPFIRP